MFTPKELEFKLNVLERADNYRNEIAADRPIPEVLFHYTGQTSLLGILEKRCFWATDVRFMNDAREFRYAIDLAAEVLEQTPSALKHSAQPHLRQEVATLLSSKTGANTFMVCFSAKRDHLSQWRGYTKSGAGYSIGFPFELVQGITDSSEGGTFFLQRCLYNLSDQRRLVEEWLADAERMIHELWPDVGDSGLRDSYHVASEVAGLFASAYAPFFKDPAFKEEDEWRLVRVFLHSPTDVRFRQGPSTLIPYVVLPFSDRARSLELAEVIVGPTPLPELSAEAIRTLLQQIAGKEIPVENTRNPYRAW